MGGGSIERRRRACGGRRRVGAEPAGEGFDGTASGPLETGNAALTLELGNKVTPPACTVAPPAWTVTPAGLGAAGARVTLCAVVAGCFSVGAVIAWSVAVAGRRELA